MRTARRTHGFTDSVIRGMTRLAAEHGAINLAQGFPNFPAPEILKEAGARAIRDDVNQYAITWGAKRLRDAVAAKYAAWYGLEVDPDGTEFQRRVWAALRRIPAGETTSYGAIARELAMPTASRAVGAANGANPVAIVVPCHRVISSGGGLGGYGGGVALKRRLLALESGTCHSLFD